MTKYYFYIIFEDGNSIESIISSQKDVERLSRSRRAYEAIKIYYYDNPQQYCHVINGRDNVFLRYYKDDKCLYYSQFDDSEEFTKVIKLKGVGKEEIFTDSIADLPITFKGKLLPDEQYERLIKQCEEWRRPLNK